MTFCDNKDILNIAHMNLLRKTTSNDWGIPQHCAISTLIFAEDILNGIDIS